MKDNSANQLRLSVDLRSLSQHEFTAQLFLKYPPHAPLGLSTLRSASQPVPNAKVQTPLKDCFATGYFQASASEVAEKLSHNLRIELWHNDRFKKDQLLGIAVLQLNKILQQPLRQTSESFARVLDILLPVDEVDQAGKPVKTIGSLRAIAYLEDLGPADKLEQRGFKVKDLLEEVEDGGGVVMSGKEELPPERAAIESAGLNELERKVVWELETWKKAEEAKAKIVLKQKEIEFWTNLSEQQRKSDLQKEKQFKKIQANLILLQGKLRSKIADLGKREQKIMTLEQQLATKITEVSREVMLKDQEIESLRRRHKEDKNGVIKDKAAVEVELAKTRASTARLKVEVEQLRKEDDKAPLNILKSQITAKNYQIKELSRELEKANQVKEEYKIYYGKMKEQVISLRDKLQAQSESVHQVQREKDILANNYRNLEQQLAYERQMAQQQQQRGGWAQQEYEEEEYEGMGERERLIRQRQSLIREHMYAPSDPTIIEINRQIQLLS